MSLSREVEVVFEPSKLSLVFDLQVRETIDDHMHWRGNSHLFPFRVFVALFLMIWGLKFVILIINSVL